MTIDVVVARFNEDVGWTAKLRHDARVLFYDKGESRCLGSTRLPNVGREAHTYLWHIVDNYMRFPDWTFFTQGDPNRHMPFSHLQGIINGFPATWFRSALWIESGPMFFVNRPVCFEGVTEGENQEKGVGDVWRELFEGEPPVAMVFAPAAIFAISRARLESRSLSFYKLAMELASRRARGAWEFERLWAYLWTSSAATKL